MKCVQAASRRRVNGRTAGPGAAQRRRWLAFPACLGLAAGIALSGCSTAQHQLPPPARVATPSSTRTPVGAADWSCLNTGERRAMFVLPGPGPDRLAALSIGTGPVAVVLAHQAFGSFCQWWPYARSLAARFRVVAFDFDAYGASPRGDGNWPGEVAAAAQWARQHGARKIVLMGASMGGTAVMVAAAHLGDAVTGVIDLSGPAMFVGMDALAAAKSVHVPVLFGHGTGDTQFAADVRHVRAVTAAHDKPVVTVRGSAHGVELVDPPAGYARARRAVLWFIETITR